MTRRAHARTGILLAAALATLAPLASHAQMRRRAAPPGEAPPADAPSLPRVPFAGAWEGTVTLRTGPGADAPRRLRVRFDVADTVRGTYAGATILPDDARAAHLETVAADGGLRWRLPNSGGGAWVYQARLVAPDSLEGTVVLRDWPQRQRGERPPGGTFVLVRRAAGGARAGGA